MRLRLLVSAAVIACVAALAACDPVGQPTSAPSTSGTVTATPSPSGSAAPTTPAATADPAGARAFGGDCSAMLDPAELADLFGLDMSLITVNWSWGAITALNGLKCTWASTGTYMGAALVASALPAADVPAEFPAEASCDDAGACQAVTVVDGTWYGVRIPDAPEGTDRQVVASTVLDRIVAAGAQLPAPTSPAAPAGTWSTPLPACADVAERLDPAAFGLTEAPEVVEVPSESAPNLGALDVALTGGEWCGFSSMIGELAHSVYVLLLPGAGGAYDEVVAAAGQEALATDAGRASGVTLPFIWEGDGGVLGTDGANLAAMTTNRGIETVAYTAAINDLLRVMNAG